MSTDSMWGEQIGNRDTRRMVKKAVCKGRDKLGKARD